MATYRNARGSKSLARPWIAKRKRNGISHHLGYYPTKHEAELVERTFDFNNPRSKNDNYERKLRKEMGYAY